MKHFFLKSPHSLISSIALWTSFLNFLSSDFCYTQSSEHTALETSEAALGNHDESKYMVNFNHVPVVEVIRFVSKITKTNFVFEESELQFNVTVISEEPISVKNIMSALIQILRIHNLRLLEQDGNLIITKSSSVNQIPTLILPESPQSIHTQSPIVTRVFRIKNANPSSIAAIIKSMVSSSSQVEVSAETRQLIVTDILTNIDQIASLLVNLDTPHTRLEIESYVVKNKSPADIISLTQQILSAFAEGNPLILVPQQETNTIFIVSTPYLIERALTVMEDLDIPSKHIIAGDKEASKDLYIYKTINKTPQEVLSNIQHIYAQMTDHSAGISASLLLALKTAKTIPDSNSLVFITDSSSWIKLKELLDEVDASQQNTGINSFWVYKIQNTEFSSLKQDLHLMAQNISDPDLLKAIDNMKWIPESNSIVFTAPKNTLTKIQEVIPAFDSISSKAPATDFYIFQVEHASKEAILSALTKVAENLNDLPIKESIRNMKWLEESHSFLFHGSPSTLEQLQSILPKFDIPSSTATETDFYIFQVENASKEAILSALTKVADNLNDSPIKESIRNMKWLEDSHSFLFYGSPTTLQQLQSILSKLDIASSSGDQQSFIYQVQNISQAQALSALDELAKATEDPSLIKSLNNVKWIKENNSLLFNGSTETLNKLKTILPTLDFKNSTFSKSHFIIYTPIYQKGEVLNKELSDLSTNLKNSGLENSDLLDTLNSIKWTPSTNSILFTGDSASLARVQTILSDLDKQNGTIASTIFLYSPLQATPSELKNSLIQLGKTLNVADASNQTLIAAIQNAELVPETNAILFSSDEQTLVRLKQLIATLDHPDSKKRPDKTISNPQGFYLYKLQQAPGNIVIQNLKGLTEHISSEDPRNAGMIKVVQELKWIKENNSILLTGSSDSIELVKALISEFDIPTNKGVEASDKSEFFIYKPKMQTPEQIQTSLEDFALDLEKSNLNDLDFIQTLRSTRIVTSSKSLVFTGTPESLTKLKTILITLDESTGHSIPIQTIGSTTFLIYKVQKTSATELMSSLQTFSKQLGKSDVKDKTLAASLDSVKWIKETNSLLFTGTEDTLRKVESLISKFDIPSENLPTISSDRTDSSSTFFVYSPKYQDGSELIQILNEFKENLIHSGISDSSLFDAISHLKFIEKTNSLIVSGSDPAIEKIQALLLKFDVLGKGTNQPEISSIDDTNFLIYKLQYHKGLEIQTALKKIASSLSTTEKATNKPLVECIASLQWIEVTNSLLGTGESSTLEKVKGLIHNLDVPLKQVFIEVLVIETTISNSQSFGLQWGSQLQYLNKTIGAMGNFPPSGTGANILQTPLSLTTAANPPVQGSPSTNSVPFTNGFDIGVIGDIIFHKGKSFLSLGSLLNAIQTDADSTIVMNPKIMAQDGHTSNIFVGLNIPFVGSYVSNTSNNTTQTSNIEYRDVGFNLTVTPTLGTNDIITLDISQDISQQVGTSINFSGTTVTGIETSHATMTTRIHVPDRHFLILSGMLQDTKDHSKQGLPCLGGLPMVGALFSQNTLLDSKFNVIIFMKPYILHSMDEFDHITGQEETLFKDDAVLPDVKETIDSGYERLKNIE